MRKQMDQKLSKKQAIFIEIAISFYKSNKTRTKWWESRLEQKKKWCNFLHCTESTIGYCYEQIDKKKGSICETHLWRHKGIVNEHWNYDEKCSKSVFQICSPLNFFHNQVLRLLQLVKWKKKPNLMNPYTGR